MRRSLARPFTRRSRRRKCHTTLTDEAVEAAKNGQGYGVAEIEAAFVWSMEFIAGLEEKYKPVVSVSEIQGNLEGRRFFIDHLMVLDTEPRQAIVVDWKTGRMVKDALSDLQGMAYAREILSNEAYGVGQVAVMFVHPFVEKFSHAVFTSEMLDSLNSELEPVIKEAKKARPKKNPGVACKYCGLHPCAAVSKSMDTVADGTIDMARARKDPKYMAELRDLVTPFQRFIDTIKKEANAMRFDDGIEIPGYVTVCPTPRKYITEPGKVVSRLAETLELDIHRRSRVR